MPMAPADESASISPTAAVLTIQGVCAAQPKTATAKGSTAKPASAKPAAADCKTVITKAEFEKLAAALAPNPNPEIKTINPQVKRQLANVLPRDMAMSEAAKKKGLENEPQYAQMMKFARMQILAALLQRQIQAEAARISEGDVQKYYNEHADNFEQFTVERLFVPRNPQIQSDPKDEEKGEKLTEEQQKAKQEAEKAKMEAGEQSMTKLAEDLRARAAAGEDFTKLQKEAFDASGMKIASPTVTLPRLRRTGLPAAHAAVFDLKPGEVTQVINDAGGHYIYKLEEKNQMPLEQVKEEIHSKLQNYRTREMMEKINGSYMVETNEAYFGSGGPGMPGPRPGMGNRGGTPPQTAPAANSSAPSGKQN
jgi:bifunctional DNA-binding transcriptional regulator/antitoxin component of YhaV-PrlF toxin-antitoxin module